MDEMTQIFAKKGDLAHLALFLWASGASVLLVFTLKELAASNRRFKEFVRELAHLNNLFSRRKGGGK